jgi:hypothetical protein
MMERVLVGENKQNNETLIDSNADVDGFPRVHYSCWLKSLFNSYLICMLGNDMTLTELK